MRYVALLRGINVGGKRKVEMERLRNLFKSLGYTNIETYLNSGNVIFESNDNQQYLQNKISQDISNTFGIIVPTLIKNEKEILQIASAVTNTWENNSDQKTDVAYLFDEIDYPEIIEKLPVKKEFIDVTYVKGAIIWHLEKKNYTKSHLNKVISTDIYQYMTVRNANTARFLALGKTRTTHSQSQTN